MQQFFSLLSWRLFIVQHVSGVFPPIIRSSMPAVAASGFTFVSWWQSCCPKYVELQINVRIINWKIVASGWWYIWIVRWCTDLQTFNLLVERFCPSICRHIKLPLRLRIPYKTRCILFALFLPTTWYNIISVCVKTRMARRNVGLG
jgi:hypothetical protein